MRKIQGEQIDVWILESGKGKPLPDVLSGDEQAYLQELSSDVSREKYRESRNQLRWLLADYLDEEPQKIRFDYGPHGKPFIRLPKTSLQFNLSHSKDITAYAFGSMPIGIDVEKIEARGAAEKVAAKYFSSQNFEIFKALPEREKAAFFFKIWTASEAYIKGEGISVFGIEKVREQINFANQDSKDFAIGDWKVFSFPVNTEYMGALGVRALKCQINYHRIGGQVD